MVSFQKPSDKSRWRDVEKLAQSLRLSFADGALAVDGIGDTAAGAKHRATRVPDLRNCVTGTFEIFALPQLSKFEDMTRIIQVL
jgi:hypothetical protein